MPCKFVMQKAVPRDAPCRNVVAALVETAASVEICLVWESCEEQGWRFWLDSSGSQQKPTFSVTGNPPLRE